MRTHPHPQGSWCCSACSWGTSGCVCVRERQTEARNSGGGGGGQAVGHGKMGPTAGRRACGVCPCDRLEMVTFHFPFHPSFQGPRTATFVSERMTSDA